MPEHGVFTVRVRLELAQGLLIEPQIRQTATGGEQGDAIQPELMYFPISETGLRLLAPFSRAASARRSRLCFGHDPSFSGTNRRVRSQLAFLIAIGR